MADADGDDAERLAIMTALSDVLPDHTMEVVVPQRTTAQLRDTLDAMQAGIARYAALGFEDMRVKAGP